MAKVQGTCDDRFAEIRQLLQANIDNEKELGASITINIDGKEVVDIWGGYSDTDRSKPWEKDTITNVWSTTKTVTALAALVLIDRGLLDPNEKVAKYWPEFAANGKENIEVRHLLSHASGLSSWQEPVTFEDIFDREKSAALLAAQAPWWTAGTATGYHSITFGNLVGELVFRITGKTLGQFISEDLAKPLGADFQLGCKDEDLNRVSDVIPPAFDPANMSPSLADPSSIPFRSIMNPMPDPTRANTAGWRKAELGGTNGHANARGVSRLLSAVTLGAQSNPPLLSAKTVDLIFQEQQNGKDVVLERDLRFGLGFGLKGKGDNILDLLPDGQVCSWGGWGGSIVICDVGRKVTFSYVMNKMSNTVVGSDQTKQYIEATWKALGA